MGDGLNECGEQKRSAIQSTVDSAWVRVGHMQYVELVTAQQSSYEYGNNVENRSTIIHQPIFNVRGHSQMTSEERGREGVAQILTQ